MFIITKEQKDELENYIDKVDKTTNEHKNVKELSANLNLITKQVKQDLKRIKNLRKNNEELELKVDNLISKLDEQQDKINELRQDNFNLKYNFQQLEYLFKKLVNLLKKMIKKTNKRESYLEVLEDMHDNRIISNNTLYNILNNKKNTKEKDDFEL